MKTNGIKATEGGLDGEEERRRMRQNWFFRVNPVLLLASHLTELPTTTRLT